MLQVVNKDAVMTKKLTAKHIVICELIILLAFSSIIIRQNTTVETFSYSSVYNTEKNYIKWVSFGVTAKAMTKAYEYDVATHDKEIHVKWIELLAFLGARYGGNFASYKESHMDDLVKRLTTKGETIETITSDMKYYTYYYEAYSAVLGGYVGDYEIEIADPDNPGQKIWVKKYGLKVFLPLARNYPYSHYDDFGVSRSYGYKRKHLGHDMMGQVGSPIIAVESGYVEALGWNKYGGWRIGIRSFDKKRYYYYAHLRKNFPFHQSLKEGSIVQAGDVIGYLGRSGYSNKENANNISTPHLHFGIQLIFDESQKEGINEIWIDCYQLILFLQKNRSETVKDPDSKDYNRINRFIDPVAQEYIKHQIYDYNDTDIDIKIYE